MLPDVLGYPLQEGILRLEEENYTVLLKSASSTREESLVGDARIARLLEVEEKRVEVLVVKVPIPPHIHKEVIRGSEEEQ